ncbi:MAG: cell division protein FtsZ [Candidatus Berkelbacteria bacterium Licking1014_96]|uniref:Cell division protein FtsZ n=1 Tax=Candidatus Berkelbacteria bacterium Licking1014_96 TaxID=2017149 RepID=A0A554LGU4_9BACT|nr:MAG: cell division protein FtsZ [Candidatus Berkelbacteria bacterium Licking1014_96]
MAHTKVQIGVETTRGLGSGADPEIGKKALEENKDEVYEVLKDSDMVFITAGMGGGTGSGSLPGVAAIAKELGALTIAVVTKPFTFEGNLRRKQAEEGIAETEEMVDTLIVIPNDRLLQVIDKKTTLFDAFSVVDDVLRQGIQGISDLITLHGIINVDFADIKTIMKDAGTALMGIGRASGDNRAIEAARAAIDSPLLELSIDGAKGILFNITGSSDLSMYEIDEAAKAITEAADPSANIIFGAMVDEAMSSEVKITVIATGFDQGLRKKKDKTHEARPVLGLGGLPPLTNETDEDGFEEPVPAAVSSGLSPDSEERDDMEVPAFIRRKLK